MEIKNFAVQKLHEIKGTSIYIFILILSVLITVGLVSMEYFRVSGIYDSVTAEMERAANIAIEYSMIDEARGYHISEIDPDIAAQQFDLYFRTRLGLGREYQKNDDEGAIVYQVAFDSHDIDAEKSQILMQGDIYITMRLVGNYITGISMPFNIKTRNVNIID